MPLFAYVTLLAFWTVLAAELVGDRSLYTIASLSLRFRVGALFVGITAAFAAKMLAAVLLAHFLVQLNSRWTDLLSAVAFFISAVFLWFKEPERPGTFTRIPHSWWGAAFLGFASIVFVEWGEPSQIAVAALATKFQSLLAAWLGGTLGMAAKGILAITVGSRFREKFPLATLRAVTAGSCCLLGLLSLRGFFLR